MKNKRKNMKKKLTSVLLLTVMLVSAISSAAVTAADNANEGNELVAADILDMSIDVEEQTVTNGSTDGQPIELSTNSDKGSITCEYDESIGMNVAKIREQGYIKFDYLTDTYDYTTNMQNGFTLEAYMSVTWDTTASAKPTGHPLYSWVNEGSANGQSGFGVQAYNTNSFNLRFDTEVETDEGTTAKNYNHVFTVESGKYFHLVFIYDQENRTTTLYVDGEHIITRDIDGTLRLENEKAKVIFWGCGIEYNAVPNNYIDTNVAIGRVYDDALDETDVSMLYNDVVAAKKDIDTRPMLDTKYQTEDSNDRYNIRFVSSMDNYENYQEAGFVFSVKNDNPILNGTNCVTKTTEKLYTTMMADGEAVYVQNVYGTQSNYMYAFEIQNVPAGATIYTRSYIKLMDETVIYGDLREISTLEELGYEITQEVVD